MAPPPYDGQGTPLDPSTKLTGQWVMKDHLFLFQPPPDSTMTAIRVGPNDNCPGFNVEWLAAQLKITAAEVTAANRAQTLAAHWQDLPQPTERGADRSIRYFFMMPDGNGISTDLHLAKPRGNA
jgi:hypothetical protein